MEQQVLDLILQKELELTAKGYTPEQISGAIKRARKWAESIAKKVHSSSRDKVFLELFIASLAEAEDWLKKVKGSTGKWKAGLEATGLPVGPQTQSSYEKWAS